MARKSRRKTADAAELSRVLSEASKRRFHFRGGRPRTVTHDQGTRTIAVRGLDYAVFRAFAQKIGKSLIDTLHVLAFVIVEGKSVKPQPYCKPDGWRYLFSGGKG